jgi:NADH dehydrogenase FAD-containing subunit
MTGTQTQIIVIGAGYAGILAAVRLAGKTRRTNTCITLVNASDVFVERLRLHELAAGKVIQPRPIVDTLAGTGVQFVRGRVTQIDPVHSEITLQAPTGIPQQMHYDKLLVTLGSTIDRHSVPGVAEYAYVLTPDGERSAPALRQALQSHTDGRAVIVGGGATGIEAAAEIRDAYSDLSVHLVTQGRMGLFLNEEVAAYMRQSLLKRGVAIQEHTTIKEVRASSLLTTDGESISYDVCVWTGGFAVPKLARDSGLAVNERGQILIDPFMRSVSHPNVYAAGDCANPAEEPGVAVRMSAYTAVITGAHAADCLAAAVRGQQPKPLSFAYAGQGIALGRQRGVGFGKTPDDRPKAPYFTERVGYEVRELFVRLLMNLPNLERRLPGIFYWPGKGRYAAMKRRAAQNVRAGQQS